MIKVGEHRMPRNKAYVFSSIGGAVIGLYSSIYTPVDLTLDAGLLLSFALAFTSIIILHEAIHGIVAVIFGFKPLFGHKFPTVYVIFEEKIPREQFMITAMAPFIILNAVFGILFAGGIFKIFCFMCLILNTIGSVGDLWLTFKLFSHESGTIVQDLKTGIAVYK
ncbi:MAG: DUF3267 domain-containing protein [Desulfobacteraceae bacterium]